MELTRITGLLVALALLVPCSSLCSVPDSLKRRIDSLIQVARVTQGPQKYQAEFKIAWDLFDLDNEMAVSHAAIAYELAVNENDTMKIVRSGRLYGQLLRRIHELDSAVIIFEEILPLAERIPGKEQMGKILTSLALAYNFQGKFDQALSTNFKSLRLVLTTGDSVSIGACSMNIGLIFYHMGNTAEALTYFERASKVGDSLNASYGLINVGLAKLHLNDHSAYPDLARRGLRMAPLGHTKLLTIQYDFGYGLYFFKTGYIDSAEYHYTRALNQANAVGDVRMASESKIRLAECRVRHGAFESAIRTLKQVEIELTNSQYNHVRLLCYNTLSFALEKSKNWEESLSYRLKYVSLRDSLYHQQVQNNMTVARVEFEERENQLRIAKQAEIIELNDKVIGQQRLLNVISVSLALVLVCLVFLFYKFSRYQKMISRELDKKVTERTRELQLSENALAKSLAEQTELMRLVSQKVKASIATFRGLWRIGAVESPEKLDCISEKLELTADELLSVSSIIDRSGELRRQFTDEPAEMVTGESF